VIITQRNADAKGKLKAVNGPSIMIATSGSGIMRVGGKEVDLRFGFIFFTEEVVNVGFETKDEKMVERRAYAE
jgi:mannose-6-phosphate isomerase class I